MKKTKTFTLIEIIVSTVILSAIFGGLIASYIAVKNYISRAYRRSVSVALMKNVLNDLYLEVSPGWNTPATTETLALGVHALPDYTVGGLTYTNNSYTVSAVAGSDCREVAVSINFTE